jgi:hypothetical protein
MTVLRLYSVCLRDSFAVSVAAFCVCVSEWNSRSSFSACLSEMCECVIAGVCGGLHGSWDLRFGHKSSPTECTPHELPLVFAYRV